MKTMSWAGVMPAITTPFHDDLTIDHPFLARHAGWLVDHGATALVALGSLGEGATLAFEEKTEILTTCMAAVGERVPVVAAISALSTAEAVALAQRAEHAGCAGLMVLPPYVYRGSWEETRAHFTAVLAAVPLPAMIYNNPLAYGTDLVPEQLAELAAAHPQVGAVKESSGDVRRMTAVRALLGERLAVFAGLDDMVVEGTAMGGAGWVAGLANALPAESVALFELARAGRMTEAFELYRWFLPLLRLDTSPDFVQAIKLVQQELGTGSETVRPPRRPLQGEPRRRVLELIQERMAVRSR